MVACAAWPVVTRICSDPRWLFFRLAILVTLVLWLPDIYILHQGQPGRAVAVLMTMHLGHRPRHLQRARPHRTGTAHATANWAPGLHPVRHSLPMRSPVLTNAFARRAGPDRSRSALTRRCLATWFQGREEVVRTRWWVPALAALTGAFSLVVAAPFPQRSRGRRRCQCHHDRRALPGRRRGHRLPG